MFAPIVALFGVETWQEAAKGNKPIKRRGHRVFQQPPVAGPIVITTSSLAKFDSICGNKFGLGNHEFLQNKLTELGRCDGQIQNNFKFVR